MLRSIAILLGFFLTGCTGTVDPVLDAAASLMMEHPDSAYKILSAVGRGEIRSKRTEARYALLYSQALDKNCIDISDDSLITIAVDYYDRRGTDRERALAHYYRGRIYENGNDVDNAVKSYILSEEPAARVNDVYLLGLINFGVGYHYDAQYSFPEALDRFRKAAGYFNDAGATRNEAIVLSRMARTYFLMGEYERAYKTCNEAIELYESIGEKDGIQDLYESIAAIQSDRNEHPDSLKKILRAHYSVTNSGEIPVTSLGLWQSFYMNENKLDSARICGNGILNNRTLFTDSQIAGCLIQMGRIEYRAGNYEKAYRYQEQYGAVIDSFYMKTREHIIQETERKYNNQLLEEANRNLRIRQRYQNIIIVLLAVILVTGGILIGGMFIRWRKRVRHRIRCAEAEIMRLRSTCSELQSQYKTIKIKAATGDEKEVKVMEALKVRLRGLCDLVENTRTAKASAFVRQFQTYMKVNVRSDISLSDLQYVVNKNYHGIIDYLEANYPKLTRQDLDLCSLLCFGFSQYGICYIYGTEIQTFYNKRHRLRERLGLKQNQKIEVFIRDLIEELARRQPA